MTSSGWRYANWRCGRAWRNGGCARVDYDSMSWYLNKNLVWRWLGVSIFARFYQWRANQVELPCVFFIFKRQQWWNLWIWTWPRQAGNYVIPSVWRQRDSSQARRGGYARYVARFDEVVPHVLVLVLEAQREKKAEYDLYKEFLLSTPQLWLISPCFCERACKSFYSPIEGAIISPHNTTPRPAELLLIVQALLDAGRRNESVIFYEPHTGLTVPDRYEMKRKRKIFRRSTWVGLHWHLRGAEIETGVLYSELLFKTCSSLQS